ncbi:putative ABC transporter, permease protein [Streptomyces hiroshimensis]|uniref:ABC transporter, permease protein n=1 Tax=Streptomyces hiroshimensis TaxID=66424 RepID=A0ABQ2ZG44_9ACTN|nr:putative ABC transporter, permease protein [Streptomyces hiroshimensis]
MRLLFINQCGIDAGFYLLIPFLATYIGHDLGMSAAIVGLVLGVRNLSQQGMYIIGGTAADRLGPRVVIIAGCALRTVGFTLFSFGNSLPLLLAASGISGLAAALFYPAVRSYVSHESGERKAEAFALLNVFATIGSLVGLLAGSVLYLTDFRICALTAAGLFAALTVAQAFVLPAREVAAEHDPILRELREVLGNRRFLCFAFATTGMFIMENQLYMLLPDGAQQASGWGGAEALLLSAGAVANLLFQFRITRGLEQRGGGMRWVGAGIAVIGLGFVPPLLVCDAAPPDGAGDVVPRLLVMVSASLLLYFGGMVAYPPVLGLIPRFGSERLTGTYFGLFYVLSGATAAGGNAVIGWVMDVGERTGRAWLPWVSCLFFGLASGCAVAWLYRSRALPCPYPAESGRGAGTQEAMGLLPGQPRVTDDAGERRTG